MFSIHVFLNDTQILILQPYLQLKIIKEALANIKMADEKKYFWRMS